MSVKSLTRSFAGGVLTPEMFGRMDLTKYQTGLAEAVNFEILPHGPAANRPGFEYVLEVKDSTKAVVLLPFIYSTTQSAVLEFGDLYMRIHTNGATVLEAAKTITGITQPAGVVTSAAHGFSNGNEVYLAAITGMTELTGRFVIVSDSAANTFRMKDKAGNYITTGTYTAYAAGGTVSRVYEIVTPYIAADLADIHFTQSADVVTLVHPTYQQRELRRLGATNWTLTTLSFTPTQVAPTTPAATASGAGAIDYTYVVTAVATDGLEESVQSAEATCANDITIAGHTNLVTWTDAASAVRYNVYKKLNGLYGYIGQGASGVAGVVDNNITPDTTKTPPIQNDPFVGATNYPSEVGYFQGRRWFADTIAKKQNVWATRSGTESNMSFSIPTRDDDAIAFRIAARQANTIRHFVPLSELLMLTSGGEWHLSSAAQSVITPKSVDPKQDGAIGASNVRPVITSTSVIYAQDRGGRVREMQFSWQQQNYKTEDVSIMAPHYFDAYTITDMAFARAPQPIIWMIRSDGVMLGLTYVPEHQVSAWHSHDTDGLFEACTVVPEGSEDVLYVVVRRIMQGRTVRCVERLRTRLFGTLPHAFFVDCGLTYSGAATTTIGGLWHLEGQTVSILGDGAVFPRQVVTNGRITLSQPCSIVNVGLRITAKLMTLPMSLEAQAAGQGVKKNVNATYVRVYQSSGVFVGPSYDNLRQMRQRTTETYGTPPSLFSGVKKVTLTPTWSDDGQVCVEQTDPLPVTVLSMTLDVALGG